MTAENAQWPAAYRKKIRGILWRLLSALFLGAWAFSAWAQSAYQNDIIAKVDGSLITRQDLDGEIQDRIRKSYELSDDHLIRLKVLKQLITEIVAEKRMSEAEISKNARLFRNLEATRRNILTQTYIDQNAVLKQPNEADIKKYVSEHPEFFMNRKVYHYSELIIAPKTEPRKKAVNERLKLLTEFKEPSPQNVQMVIDWLESNNTVYGYAKDWRASEAVPDTLRKTVMALAESDTKVLVETQGGIIRVVSVFGAYPDPIDPVMSQNAIVKAILDRERNEKVDAIINDMLAHAEITLYDRSLSDLKIPKFKGAVAQPSLPWARRLFISWNFALLVFAPLSLYVFFRQGPPPQQDYEVRTVFDAISFNVLFRVAVVVVAGAVLLLPTATALAAEYANTGKETYLSLAFFGVAVGLAAAFALSKIAFFKDLLSARWLSLSVLLLIQISSALMLD
jgi:EpsD family peptidyl-prolyl cis-trans isomerase